MKNTNSLRKLDKWGETICVVLKIGIVYSVQCPVEHTKIPRGWGVRGERGLIGFITRKPVRIALQLLLQKLTALNLL